MEFLSFLFIFVVGGLVFGFVGATIAENKGASKELAFWLGFLFWVFGLIIVALLSPEEEQSAGTTAKPKKALVPSSEIEPDLSNAQYKVWLIESYGIEKNDVLGEYVCGTKSFKQVDKALDFAHAQELEKRAEAKKKDEELERAWQERKMETAGENSIVFGFIIFFLVLVLSIIAFLGFFEYANA